MVRPAPPPLSASPCQPRDRLYAVLVTTVSLDCNIRVGGADVTCVIQFIEQS